MVCHGMPEFRNYDILSSQSVSLDLRNRFRGVELVLKTSYTSLKSKFETFGILKPFFQAIPEFLELD